MSKNKEQGKSTHFVHYLLIQGSFCKSLEESLKILEKSVKIWPPNKKHLWYHQDITYVGKYYIILLIYSCFQVVKRFIFVPVWNLIWYFDKRRKIVPVKECHVSLCMTGRCLLTSILKIYIKFPFFWYITCLVRKMSNNFNLSDGRTTNGGLVLSNSKQFRSSRVSLRNQRYRSHQHAYVAAKLHIVTHKCEPLFAGGCWRYCEWHFNSYILSWLVIIWRMFQKKTYLNLSLLQPYLFLLFRSE